MKTLVIGVNGFIGSHVAQVLAERHDVIGSSSSGHNADVVINLMDIESIGSALQDVKPQAIVNCAGVVANTETAVQNEQFTHNLLAAVANNPDGIERIVICGSAAVYGHVQAPGPVAESAPLQPFNDYGRSKLAEEQQAAAYRAQGLPVVIARIFNPIGSGMGEKFLVTNIIKQLQEIEAGSRSAIEISRRDSLRDYLDVRDVATAIGALITQSPKELVYNIGSGVATSNEQLIDLIVNNSKIDSTPLIVETADQPEQPVASQADITRMQQEFGWSPTHTLEQTVKEIINEQ